MQISAASPARSGVDGVVGPGDQSTTQGSAAESSSCVYLLGSDGKARADLKGLGKIEEGRHSAERMGSQLRRLLSS